MNAHPPRKTTASPVRITVMDYDGSSLREHDVKDVEECVPYRDKPTVTWINVEGLDCPDVLARLEEAYGVHHLMLEDITQAHQRPRMVEYGSHVFVLARMLSRDRKESRLQEEQVSFILGNNFLITFQEGREGDVFDPVRRRLRSGYARLREAGADYLLHALLAALVERYFDVIDVIGEDLQAMDTLLFQKTDPGLLKRMSRLKKDFLTLRRSVWPLREAVHSLARGESVLVRPATEVYFRDLYNNVIQAADKIEVLRDTASGMLEIYLSTVSYRTNEVMKVLTIIATIFMPLTFIAGVYGMNFNPHASPFNMPELLWPFGYIWALGLMSAVAAGMLVYFRKRRWL
jgi:magnesium transporter